MDKKSRVGAANEEETKTGGGGGSSGSGSGSGSGDTASASASASAETMPSPGRSSGRAVGHASSSSMAAASAKGAIRALVRAAKWIPVLFIVSIVVWSYYAYVVQLCLLTVDSMYVRVALILLYHIFFGLFVASYWQTIFNSPGSVPHRFYLSDEDMERIESSDNPKLTLERMLVAKDLPCTMRSMQQEVRYCSECSLIKPDRAHHCSVCGKCVLKMDHHCPWVNNCVAFMNYKFFILFLGYALLYCIYVALSSIKYFLDFWSANMAGTPHGKFHVLFLFFVSAMFSVSLASLFGYHVYLVSRNMTTLEAFRPPVFRHGPDKFAFHLGKISNFQEVFGDNKLLWFLPVFSSFGDGLTYPQRNQLDEEAGLLDRNGCAANPSSNSPPQFPSEESVPMMLHAANETEDEDAGRTGGGNGDWRHVTSSSGSSVNSNGGAAELRPVAQQQMQPPPMSQPPRSGPAAVDDLVSVTM